ncbi:MAG: Tad domain-containing protein [Myxococcales bacterium]
MRKLSRNLERRPTGQVILLGSVFILLLSFALMMVLTVSWATHERIRIQHAADAQAYSQAVQTARAFNYMAYSNRAAAGALVSMAVLSSYESEASAAVDLWWSHGVINIVAMGCEFGICCSCPWGLCCKLNHCWHAFEDLWTAIEFFTSAGDIADDVKELDSPFKKAMDGFQQMVQTIKYWNFATLGGLSGQVFMSGGVADLDDYNLPAHKNGKGETIGMVNAINTSAIFGSVNMKDATNDERKHKDMTEVANASRGGWTRGRNWGLEAPVILAPLSMKIHDEDGGWWVQAQIGWGLGGKAGITEDGDLGPSSDIKGDGIKSRDFWYQVGMCQHNCCGNANGEPGIWPISLGWGWFMPAVVYTSSDGGEHDSNMIEGPHDTDNHDLDVDQAFTVYSIKMPDDVEPEAPYKQPAIFAAVKQHLSVNENGGEQPWMITRSGTQKPKLVGEQQDLNFKGGEANGGGDDTDLAFAMAKALVYYHRPGDWREPPSFWNPFWRAKLHPFTRGEAALVAGATGHSNTLQLVGAGAIVGSGLNFSSGSQVWQDNH